MSFKYTQDEIYSASSLAATTTTSSVDCRFLNQGSCMVVITTGGAVSWTVSIQGSNDDSTFVDLVTPSNVTGTTNLLFEIPDMTCLFYRLSFTRTSGTLTTVSALFGAKG